MFEYQPCIKPLLELLTVSLAPSHEWGLRCLVGFPSNALASACRAGRTPSSEETSNQKLDDVWSGSAQLNTYKTTSKSLKKTYIRSNEGSMLWSLCNMLPLLGPACSSSWRDRKNMAALWWTRPFDNDWEAPTKLQSCGPTNWTFWLGSSQRRPLDQVHGADAHL